MKGKPLFDRTKVTRPPQVPVARVIPSNITHSIYKDTLDPDGIILSYMFVRDSVIATAAIQIDSLVDDEKALIRVERIGGGEEFSFEAVAGYNTIKLFAFYKAGDRIKVRSLVPITGVWLAFAIEANNA